MQFVTYHHLVDVSFGGVVALSGFWCAASRQHWAWRWGLVTAIALVSLLANAFQPVMQAISAAMILSIVVMVWRWWTGANEFPRIRSIAIRDLLLATAFFAVVAAFAARVPEFQVFDWGGMVGTGLAIAMPTLLAAWLVFGDGWWVKRVLFGLPTFCALAIGAYGLRGLWYWFYWPNSQSQYTSFGAAALDWFSPNQLGWQWEAFGPTLLLGVAVLCVALTGTKHSGWFGGDHRGSLQARLALTVPLLLMGYLDLRVLGELAHPTPIPAEEIISPNGWDDIVAAGAMISGGGFYSRQQLNGMSETELAAQIEKWSPVYQRIEEAVSKPLRAPSPYLWLSVRDSVDASNAAQRIWTTSWNAKTALWAKALDADQRGDSTAELDTILLQLKLRKITLDVAAADDVWQVNPASDAVGRSRKLREKIDRDATRRTLEALVQFDAEYPSFMPLEARQRIIDENNDWSEHLALLLDDWSGKDHYRYERLRHNWNRALLRITIAEYALGLFETEQGILPASLAELTPRYLEAITVDPFDGRPLRYERLENGYLLYSVGTDAADNGGALVTSDWMGEGDLTGDVLMKY